MAESARAARGAFAVFAAYVGFLLFAQFGLLEQVRSDLRDPRAVQAVMAAMGLSGLAASLCTGAWLRRRDARAVVRAALAGFAAVAALSVVCHGTTALAAAAALTGVSIGVLTVSIAASLPDLVGRRRTGLAAGTATGGAYFVCNVPWLFAGTPALRALVPAAIALVAAALLPRARRADGADGPARPGPEPVGEPAPRGGSRADLARAVVAFGALVLLDSAAFAVVQAQPALKALSWGSPSQQFMQGVFHLAGAIGAGIVLDLGALAAPLIATWVLFALAFPLLVHGGPYGVAGGPLYAVGISIYSAALVFYPARGGSGARPAARWRAALVYGVGGWIGSALGVGAAQDLGTIPPWLVLAAGAAVVLAFAWPSAGAMRALGRRAGLTIGVALAGATGWWSTHLLPPPPALAEELEHAAERGREVYIAEGCIHCHSQYVRPLPADIAPWGPPRPVDRAGRPVLVGNRRQGPDLANVGNRRAPLWNEAHLKDPRTLRPGSRMPSYAHLFAPGDVRGRDLVVYLDALGRGTTGERVRSIDAEPPPRPPRPPSAARGRALFAAWCTACHGASGRGDGPLAEQIGLPALNLRRGVYDTLKGRPPGERVDDGLARVVRHGFPPTPMPGHETLPDQDVADLVAFVRSLEADAAGAAGATDAPAPERAP